ncbi:unnamed protein product [Musa acuminata subsp. burmannicoides]
MFPLLFIQIRRKDFPQQNKQNREISSYNWGNLIFYHVGKILSSIMPPQDGAPNKDTNLGSMQRIVYKREAS